VTPDIKKKLDAEAKASGRTQSQEAEFRLEASFRNEDLLSQVLQLAYGRQFAGVLMMLGRVMRRIGERCALDATYSYDAVDRWFEVPYAANQAILAAMRVLERCRPPGPREFPEEIAGAPVRGGDRERPETRGSDLADVILEVVARPEMPPTAELAQFAAQVRPLLGELQIRVPADPSEPPEGEGV
jgi:hypothetical protein